MCPSLNSGVKVTLLPTIIYAIKGAAIYHKLQQQLLTSGIPASLQQQTQPSCAAYADISNTVTFIEQVLFIHGDHLICITFVLFLATYA